MYSFIVKRKIIKAFSLVNAHTYEPVIRGVASNIYHEFAGEHALSGIRRNRSDLLRWFQRLHTVLPSLRITIDQVIVQGNPARTYATVLWHVTANLADGSNYANNGVYVMTIRWGVITHMRAWEDTALLCDALSIQAAHGIVEANAPPIHSVEPML